MHGMLESNVTHKVTGRGDPGPLGHIYQWDIAFTRIVVKIRNQIFEIAALMVQLSFQP